jgi:hypothetical protein
MMARDDDYSALRTTVTYRDVLWSYQSAKGYPGWPEESELKGKREYVILGRSIKAVEVERR